MERTKIIDAHTDLFWSIFFEQKDFLKDSSSSQINWPKIKKGQIKCFFAGLFGSRFKNQGLFTNFEELVDLVKKGKEILSSVHNLELILGLGDLKRLWEKEGAIGYLLHLEGGDFISRPQDLEALFGLGFRSLGLVWNLPNQLGGGVNKPHFPLTHLGKEIIKIANKKGIVIDLAHANEKTFHKALEVSEKPVIVSHANCYNLCPHPRNLKDEQIKALKEKKGVMGIFFSSKYLKSSNQASLEDVIAHISYVAEKFGVEVVGLGSDFGGILSGVPFGLENIAQMKKIGEKLAQKGFNKQEIAQIMGENFFNVLEEVFKK